MDKRPEIPKAPESATQKKPGEAQKSAAPVSPKEPKTGASATDARNAAPQATTSEAQKAARPVAASAAKRPAASSAAKNRVAGAKRGGKEDESTFIQVKRTLKAGGKVTIDYSREAMSRFERFVNRQEPDKKKESRFRLRLSFTTFVAFTIVCLLIAVLIMGNTNVSTDEQTLTIVGVNDDFEGFRILHLSDLHARRYGAKQASLLRTIANLDYDAVCITGDMVGSSGDAEPFYELLEGLGTSKPVYFIAGDSDPGPLLEKARDIEGTLNQLLLEDWILGAIQRGAIYVDRPVSLKVDDSTVWISPATMLDVDADMALEMAQYELDLQTGGVLGGIGVDYETLPFTNYRYRQTKALKDAALYIEEDDLHVTMSHYPPAEPVLSAALVNALETENAYLFAPDLSLCGHYCGGVWRFPLYGAFYVPDTLLARHGWFPNRSLVSGVRQSASTVVYTSAGLGVTDYGFFPDFRLLNPPQVSLITLTTTLTDDLLGLS